MSRQSTKKYQTRDSPPYKANDYCGRKKRGNDGNWWISEPDYRGICRWQKYKVKAKSKRVSTRKRRSLKRRSRKRRSRKQKKSHRRLSSKRKSNAMGDLIVYHRKDPENPKLKKRQTAKKYLTRKSPPYKANAYCWVVTEGNDGNLWLSKPDKNGVCRWKRF